jgi:hypothetical protein
MKNKGKDEFWLEKDAPEVIDELTTFHDNWWAWDTTPFKQAWIRNYLAYYSPAIMPQSWDTSLIFEGMQGELTRFYTPKSRTLIRQLTSIVTKQRLEFKASAETVNGDVLNEIKLANAVCDQLTSTQRLDNKADQLCEGALVCGQWFTKTTWRTDIGESRIRDSKGKIIRSGGVEIDVLSPFNVFYNILCPWDRLNWAECQVKRNKWDLIADHPDLRDEILNIPTVQENRYPDTWFKANSIFDEDLVNVYEFYHRPTPSLPEGRMIVYGSRDAVLYDGKNPYGCIPIESNIPEVILDTGIGYPKLTDLMGAQEMFDNNLSAIATNHGQFAVQSVTIPRGSDINVNQLDGMKFISFTPQDAPGGGKPEALNLTQTPAEVFKFTDKLENLMQDLSMLNGAMTGNLPPGISSGTAIATLSANSIEFITSISKAQNLCLEKTMMHAVNAYQKFGAVPQKVMISQKGGQSITREFTGDELKNVSAIKLEMINPLLKTFAGRLEVAEKLLTVPKEVWPDYVSVLEGRPLSNVYRGELDQMDLIVQENEFMEKGEKPLVMITDDHALHIKRHADMLSDVGNRLHNQKAVQAITEHIMEHYQLAKSEDPGLRALVSTGRIPEGGLNPQPPAMAPTGQSQPIDQPQRQSPDEPSQIQNVEGDVAQPAADLLGRG